MPVPEWALVMVTAMDMDMATVTAMAMGDMVDMADMVITANMAMGPKAITEMNHKKHIIYRM